MPDRDLDRALAATVVELLRSAGAPGASVALLADGDPVLTAGVGHADLDRTRPLAADARFYAYSITKTFLAVAALRLAEQGRLGLDEPVQATLPDLPLATAITVRQLLTHTGGLPDYGGLAEYSADLRAAPDAPWTAEEFLTRTLRRGFLFPPGEGWAYSNIGFMLIRLAVERLTGSTLRQALADLVFRPSGLRRTVVAESLADAAELTPGYSDELDRDGGCHDISRRYHPGWVSHGVVISTAPELARGLDALFAGRLLGPEPLAAMLDAVAVPEEHPLVARPAYGLGVMVDLDSCFGRVAGHAGGGPGYSTAAFHFPDVAGRRVTSVALANRDGSDLGLAIAFALVTAYADRTDHDLD